MSLQPIHEISSGDLEGRVVIVRAGMNVPLKDGEIQDTYRLDAIAPTLDYLVEAGAKTLLLGHIGRDESETFEPLIPYFENKYKSFHFLKDFFAHFDIDSLEVNERLLEMTLDESSNGAIILLDNIRQTPLEKENNDELASFLHTFGDFYVHEAFPVAHRKHVSTYGLPLLFQNDSKFTGKRFHMELNTLNKVQKPEKPSLFVLGGAKIETKLPMIHKFESIYDHILIGGALYNTILKEMGKEIGISKADELNFEQKTDLQVVLKSKKLLLPDYVVCETNSEKNTKHIDSVTTEDNILDISPQYIKENADIFVSCKTVLWNGPLGYYEGGYTEGTDSLLSLVGTENNYAVIGGGDTAAAAEQSGKKDSINFISTGGGSTIDYLSEGTLPGIYALEN